MIDFPFQKLIPLPAFFCFFFLIFTIFLHRKGNVGHFKNRIVPRYKTIHLYISIIFLCCVSTYGDFFNYMDMVYDYSFNVDDNHGEPVYGDIVKFVNKNYLLFRFIVWGGAWLILFFVFRRFRLQLYNAMYILLTTTIVTFANLRASLALAIFYLGLSFLIIKDKYNFFSLLFGLFLVYISTIFHSSMVFLLVLSPICFLKFGKKETILFGIILLSCLLWGIIHFVDILSSNYVMGNDVIARKTIGNATRVDESATPYGLFAMFLRYSPYYFSFWQFSKCLFKSGINNFGIVEMRKLYLFVFLVYIISTLFAFVGLESLVLYERILFMSYIPLIIIWCYLYQSQILPPKTHSILLFSFFMSQFWDYFMMIVYSYRNV